MEKEILLQILANQVLIYKRIEDLEYKIKDSGMRSASMDTYHKEMLGKTQELIGKLKTHK